ncbi:hypothetical protein ASPWEDRAFT_44064 [Aspergillus wentii DTO 134E9]|uniref:F-box domain-containing protein n=1 Tax=Aspergillus wentii DTO 134E9 TaxID=1073089 RepID=A0A1L9RAT9_ASPWE|nr:uncharacterized protein ASPWEDRAFT_44064 [Aspergillus wentii DTO 134E9]KAI9934620.1 hypothetical protein MW887_000236 [Aspergillus wentii]OJJ32042.1 hypothetical protein ASPWEDRAFT_44064 [Aspergillus wentii DTO 134E9]
MSLLTIPNEILMLIVNKLDENNLNTLLQINRSFYDGLNTHLYTSHVHHCGGAALMWAATNGRTATAKRFLDLGVDPNLSIVFPKYTGPGASDSSLVVVQRDSQSKTLIHKDCVARWFNGEAQWYWGEEYMDQVPLLAAINRSHEGVVRLLLGHGDIDTKCRSSIGYFRVYTTLHLAAEKGHVGIMKMLLERGVGEWSYTESSGYERTVVYEAVLNRHADMVDFLLREAQNGGRGHEFKGREERDERLYNAWN